MVVISHVSSYHADQLGVAGVAIFFVLSGYLITTLLLKEADRRGRIDRRAFFIRRALRLFPALVLVVVGTPLLMWACSDPRLSDATGGLATTLFYVQDFATATGHVSVLPHAWSLAVEEQFYLAWPFVLLLIMRRTSNDPRRTARAVLALTLAAALWHMVAITFLSSDWAYYSPDSNAVFLLAGCALASWQRAGRPLPVGRRTAGLTLIGVCLIPLLATRIPVGEARWQTWVMYPVELGGVVLVLGASQLRVLHSGILRWFGKISYGLYLWNYILINILPDGRPLSSSEKGLAAIAAVGVASASWYLVEQRVLKLKDRFERVPSLTPPHSRSATMRAVGAPGLHRS
jgi:peptidoglycan/LPS O-acetylase OafA/YrhL